MYHMRNCRLRICRAVGGWICFLAGRIYAAANATEDTNSKCGQRRHRDDEPSAKLSVLGSDGLATTRLLIFPVLPGQVWLWRMGKWDRTTCQLYALDTNGIGIESEVLWLMVMAPRGMIGTSRVNILRLIRFTMIEILYATI